MPNGGTDNCMNCPHNRANQTTANVKTAPRYTRLPFCAVHHIPIWDHAWTYCKNIGSIDPDITVPINTVGLHAEGYSRVPWLGRTAPARHEGVASCAVCGDSGDEYLQINSVPLNLNVAFCSNEHYRQWHKEQLEILGFEGIYSIGRNDLHIAVQHQDIDRTASLSADVGLLNMADHFGWTPLHLAAYTGFEDGVRLLIESRADAKVIDDIGQMPIDLAGMEGYGSIVNTLQTSTFTSIEERQRALLKSAEEGNLELVEALINSEVDIECSDYRGRTPLLLAVWGGHYTTSVFLLDHGANVHVEDEYGNSPLKTVETWNSRNPSELHRLIHEWVNKAHTQDPL